MAAPPPRLVGPVDALFRQTGVIRAETLEEMFDLAAALDRQPLPEGRRVAIVSDAAGPDIVCADACRSAGLSVPPFSTESSARLAASLAASAEIANPLQLPPTAPAQAYRALVETILASDDADALIAIHAGLGGDVSRAIVDAIRQAVAAGRAGGRAKPVLACLLVPEEVGWPLAADGIPVYAFPESAAAVLGKIATYGVWRAGPHGIVPEFDDIDPSSARSICRTAIDREGEGWLPTQEAAGVLSAFHLPLGAGGLAGPSGSDGVADATAPPLPTAGVPVRVSVLDDPSFGPLVTFSLAGDHAEATGDASVRVTPLTDRAAIAMVRDIRGFAVLEGSTAGTPADLPAIYDVLLRVSRLIEEVPEVAELELDPVLTGSPGEGCRIERGRIRVALPRKGQPPRYTTPAALRAPGPAEKYDSPGGA